MTLVAWLDFSNQSCKVVAGVVVRDAETGVQSGGEALQAIDTLDSADGPAGASRCPRRHLQGALGRDRRDHHERFVPLWRRPPACGTARPPQRSESCRATPAR